MLAAQMVEQFFIERHLDIHAMDDRGNTALHNIRGNPTMLRLALAHEAGMNHVKEM